MGAPDLGLVLVEQSVAKGVSSMTVFVSFNGGHNYFKFQSYGDSFLGVNETEMF